jgi:hypothetical protein
MFFTMLYVIPLLGSILFGLILLAISGILTLKMKNKIAGILVGAVGLAFTLCPLAIFLSQIIIVRTQG